MRKYIKGKQKYTNLVDINLLLIHDIDEMMEELGCVEEGKLMYSHVKQLFVDIDFGFLVVGCDQDVNQLRSYIAKHKLIEVYTKV